MVLDAKALTWAAQNNIDTAKLKAAKVPIYGKWYFPEIPAGVALVNLETGEQQVFSERMVAGEVIYVPATDLLRAKLGPENFVVREMPNAIEGADRSLRRVAPEPLLAMARPPGYGTRDALEAHEAGGALVEEDPAELAGIHMPSPSIAPFVLGMGFCIVLVGAISHPVVLIVGLAWMLAGAIAWVRIGVLESHAATNHTAQLDVAQVEHAS